MKQKQTKNSATSCGSAAMTCYAEYSVSADGIILKDGHAMFNIDVAKDLDRKSYLERRVLILEEALKEACQVGFSDDCPLHNLDIEPWDEGCDEVCNLPKKREEWRCWRQYFLGA